MYETIPQKHIINDINGLINSIERRLKTPQKINHKLLGPNLYYPPNKLYLNRYIDTNQSGSIDISNVQYLKKLIRNEFTTLIASYQQDMLNGLNHLESKINKNSIKIKELSSSNNIDNILNIGNYNNNEYVLQIEYNKKMSEIDSIFSTVKSLIKIFKDNENKYTRDFINRKEVELKLDEFKNTIKHEINNYQNDIKLRMNNISNTFNDINNTAKLLKKINIEELINKLNINSNDLNNVKYSIDDIRNDIDNNVKNSIDDIRNDIDNNVKNSIDDIKNDIDNNVKNSIDDIRNNIVNNLEKKINDINNHITNNDNKIEKNIKDINSLKEELKTLSPTLTKTKINQDINNSGAINNINNINNINSINNNNNIKGSKINLVESIRGDDNNNNNMNPQNFQKYKKESNYNITSIREEDN